MIVLNNELTLLDFLHFNLDTATGITEFNKMLKCIRQKLYSQIPSELDKEFNKLGNENYEYDNYVVEYKKEYWNNKKIIDEIEKYRVGNLYLFRAEWCNYGMILEKVISLKPFDLYLYIKTIDEYKKEELIKYCEERGATPIFIKENYKKKE